MKVNLMKNCSMLLALCTFICTSCTIVDYVELKETETVPLMTEGDGYVAREVVTTPTIDFEEVFNPTTEGSEGVIPDIEESYASPSELASDEVLTGDDTEISIEEIEAMGIATGESTTVSDYVDVNENVEASENVAVSYASPSEVTTTESSRVDLIDNRKYEGMLNVSNVGTWQYGRTPCEWVYVEPGTHLVSNYRPNSSVKYSINSRVSSGDKGCYIPIFTSTEMKGDGFEARFYVFEDYSKDRPDNMLFSNTLDSLTYNGKTVEEILMNHKKLSKTANGILVDDNNYINIIYVTDLDEILSSE